MNSKEMDLILVQVARQNNTTIQQVRAEILVAMEDARQNADPNAKALWESIPCQGSSPTLEEFMDFIIHRLQNS